MSFHSPTTIVATSPRALAPLARFVRRRGRQKGDERAHCELCSEPIAAERHRHVVDIEDRQLRCTCAACTLLLGEQEESSKRYRAVPDRVRRDPSWTISDEQLNALGVPVSVAFFFRPSVDGSWMAVFPSPAGATEAELPPEAWARVAEGNLLVQGIVDCVEGLLVRRHRSGHCDCLVVPIDVCYELAGLLRQKWRGIDGGDEVRSALDDAMARLTARSEVVA